MNYPNEGELTATEQRVYDLVSDPTFEYAPNTTNIAATLRLQPSVAAGVLDGLECMRFIERRGGLWHPVYTD